MDTDLDQVPEPQIEPPRALKRLKRGLPEKRELPTTPFWSVEDDIEEFSSPEDTVQGNFFFSSILWISDYWCLGGNEVLEFMRISKQVNG